VTTCSVVVGYQRFGEPFCLHHPEDGSPKLWYPTTKLHDFTTQKASTWKNWSDSIKKTYCHECDYLQSTWLLALWTHPDVRAMPGYITGNHFPKGLETCHLRPFEREKTKMSHDGKTDEYCGCSDTGICLPHKSHFKECSVLEGLILWHKRHLSICYKHPENWRVNLYGGKSIRSGCFS